MSADLTVSEAERLDACEQVIERGLATFVDVGTALLEVREALRDKAQTHRLLAADERRESTTRCPNCGF